MRDQLASSPQGEVVEVDEDADAVEVQLVDRRATTPRRASDRHHHTGVREAAERSGDAVLAQPGASLELAEAGLRPTRRRLLAADESEPGTDQRGVGPEVHEVRELRPR